MGIALHTDLLADGKLGVQTLAPERQFGKENHVPGTNRSPFSRVFQPLQISSSHVRHAHRLLPSSHSWRLKANSKGGLGGPPFNCWTTPT
jgi:hypothetical protein